MIYFLGVTVSGVMFPEVAALHARNEDHYHVVDRSLMLLGFASCGIATLVINPPIDVPIEEPEWDAKQNIVCSVGRFLIGGHSKRHDVIVEVFRGLCDSGQRGWELRLVGSLHRDRRTDVEHFNRVKQLSQGYPVHIHEDANLEQVQDLYRRSAIYWHAAGYGADADLEPATLEHFGMKTAEAIGLGG